MDNIIFTFLCIIILAINIVLVAIVIDQRKNTTQLQKQLIMLQNKIENKLINNRIFNTELIDKIDLAENEIKESIKKECEKTFINIIHTPLKIQNK
ncbi:MAG: hypothetical protein ACRCUM_02480 [Mycoplasmoidaceae bacterium]